MINLIQMQNNMKFINNLIRIIKIKNQTKLVKSRKIKLNNVYQIKIMKKNQKKNLKK